MWNETSQFDGKTPWSEMQVTHPEYLVKLYAKKNRSWMANRRSGSFQSLSFRLGNTILCLQDKQKICKCKDSLGIWIFLLKWMPFQVLQKLGFWNIKATNSVPQPLHYYGQKLYVLLNGMIWWQPWYIKVVFCQYNSHRAASSFARLWCIRCHWYSIANGFSINIDLI